MPANRLLLIFGLAAIAGVALAGVAPDGTITIEAPDVCPDGFRQPTSSECSDIATDFHGFSLNFESHNGQPHSESGCLHWGHGTVEFMEADDVFPCPTDGNGYCYCVPEPTEDSEIVAINAPDACPGGYRQPTPLECSAIASAGGNGFETWNGNGDDESGCYHWAGAPVEFMVANGVFPCDVPEGNGVCYCVIDAVIAINAPDQCPGGYRQPTSLECSALACNVDMGFETHNGQPHDESGCLYWGGSTVEFMDADEVFPCAIPEGNGECYCVRDAFDAAVEYGECASDPVTDPPLVGAVVSLTINNPDQCPGGYRQPTAIECAAIASAGEMGFETHNGQPHDESGCLHWNGAPFEFMEASEDFPCAIPEGNGVCHCVPDVIMAINAPSVCAGDYRQPTSSECSALASTDAMNFESHNGQPHDESGCLFWGGGTIEFMEADEVFPCAIPKGNGECYCVRDAPAAPAHTACAAGYFTKTGGTTESAPECEPCAAGSFKAEASASLTATDTCSSCVEPNMYADEAGLSECKPCAAGHFGVTGEGATDGAHTGCDDDKCELPVGFDSNAAVDMSSCVENGEIGTTCGLQCNVGFFGTDHQEYTCAANTALTAAYQGGSISCTKCAHVLNAAEPTTLSCTDLSSSRLAGECNPGLIKDTSGDADQCIDHTKCAGGKHTQTVGTSDAEPVCKDCDPGSFKPAISASSTATDTCTAHTACAAGHFTKTAGTTTYEPECEPCAVGTVKAEASASSTATDTCTRHTVCGAGHFTKTAGTTTSEPECEPCAVGTVKAEASASSTATDTCTTHTICGAGHFTKATGTATSEPECEPCAVGTVKAEASASSTATDTCTAETSDTNESTKEKSGGQNQLGDNLGLIIGVVCGFLLAVVAIYLCRGKGAAGGPQVTFYEAEKSPNSFDNPAYDSFGSAAAGSDGSGDEGAGESGYMDIVVNDGAA